MSTVRRRNLRAGALPRVFIPLFHTLGVASGSVKASGCRWRPILIPIGRFTGTDGASIPRIRETAVLIGQQGQRSYQAQLIGRHWMNPDSIHLSFTETGFLTHGSRCPDG